MVSFTFSVNANTSSSVSSYTETEYEEDFSNCLGITPLDSSKIEIIDLPEPAGVLPTMFDWRDYEGGDWTTPVKNQGQVGTCWAFGAMGALEAAINIELNDPDVDMDLSEQYLVSCGPGSCHGGNAYNSFQWLGHDGGALPESCFPYQAADVPCDEKCEDYEDFLLPIESYWGASNQSIDAIKNALIEYGPLVADIAVYDDLQRYRGGIYSHPQTASESVDDVNHQPVIVGYNDEEECWIFKNSWGTFWGEDTYGISGEKGWFRIKYGDCFVGSFIIGVKSDIVEGEDTGKPVVELKKPVEKMWYINNAEKGNVLFGRSKVIGMLTVEADAWDIQIEDQEMTGIDRVEFFFDGTSKFTDVEEPYEWDMDEKFGIHQIRVIAYDKAGNPSEESDIIEVFIIF